MREAVPKRLYYTMGVNFVRNATAMSDLQSYRFDKLLPEAQHPIIWSVLEEAHNKWRQQPDIIEMITTDTSGELDVLNVITRLELAGLGVYNVWVDRLQCMVIPTAVRELLERKGESIFIDRRRSFVEKIKMVGKSDLFRYVTQQENDVYGVVYGDWGRKDADSRRLAAELKHRLYFDNKSNLAYRLARQIIVAGGGCSPIDW